MKKGERVSDFINNFESIIQKYELCEGAIPLSDQEKRSAFLTAIKPVLPKVNDADLFRRNTTKEMDLEELKAFALQVDAEAREDEPEKPVAQRANFTSQHNKCHRCGEEGHWKSKCPLKQTGEYLCYFCNGIKNHSSQNCPFGRLDKGGNKRNFHNNHRRNFHHDNRRGNHHHRHNHHQNRRHNRRNHHHDNQDDYKERNNHKSNKRGKINKRGRQNDHHDNQKLRRAAKDHQQNKSDNKSSGRGKSNLFDYNINEEYIDFIADSGATDHVTNKSLILSDFKKYENGVIKSANRNEFADINIDGKGNLYIRSENSNHKNIIKLTDVIAANDVSENLLSLRKLADAGFGIYLDDELFKVFDKESNKTIFEGVYEKPNWIIKFEVINNNENPAAYEKCHSYKCTARIVSCHEPAEQAKNIIENQELSVSEGDVLDPPTASSSLGRENMQSITETSIAEHNSTEQNYIGSSGNYTIDLDNVDDSHIEDMFIKNPFKEKQNNIIKRDEGMMWHIKLGHASLSYLKKLQKVEDKLKKVKFDDAILDCEVCKMANMDKLPFKEQGHKAHKPLQVIHSDIMGPIPTLSYPGRKKFIITFIDDYSRYAKIYMLKTKDEAGDALESFIISARNLLGRNEKICYIRSDQGCEYTGGKFTEILKREKIESEFSAPYTPEHNGVAERFNRTIQRKIRALMFDSGLPKSMWEYAANTAVYAYNRTPHKTIDFQVPLTKFAPDASCRFDRLKRFGCIAYAKIMQTNKSKFDARAIKAVFVGYGGIKLSASYILWHPSTRKFIESRHVNFNEKIVYKDEYKQITTHIESNNDGKEDGNWLKEFQDNEEKEEPKQTMPKKRGRPKKQSTENQVKPPPKQISENGPETRSQTKRKEAPILRYSKPVHDVSFANYIKIPNEQLSISNDEKQDQEIELRHILLASLNKDPINYDEAMASKDKYNWKSAIEEELESMKANEVWILVDRPKTENGKRPNIIDSKWVFKKKLEVDGSTRFRARLVTRGFKDRNYYDLKDTYAPVSRLSLVRTILAIVNKYDLHMCQMDVKTAFLNGILEEEVYMELPDGLQVDDNIRKTKVCKLKKALYGLKVSPKKWNKRFTDVVKNLGLQNDLHDPCLFTWRKQGDMAFILLYVDDMLIASNDEIKLEEIKQSLSEVFEMKDLGKPKSFLGMSIERNIEEKFIVIHQATYTENMLKKFNMDKSNEQSTPMVTRQVSYRNKKSKSEIQECDDLTNTNQLKKIPYREAIGSLMYLANATRPDIMFAVNFLARKQLQPTEDDWSEVKRIFRYLKGTIYLGLKFTGKTESLEAFTDASFRDHSDSTSTGGYIIKLFDDVIAWRSHKQSYVNLSTCGSEYIAMSEACQELISLDKSIRFVIGKTLFPVTVWCDNQAAGNTTKMDGSHKLKTYDDSLEDIIKNLQEREETGHRKHMSQTHGDFIKQCVDEGKVKVKWIATDQNIADIMTKPLPAEAHTKLRNKISNMISKH